jgi:Transposase, Mutator family
MWAQPSRLNGKQDILIAVVDGLKGFPEAITSVFPKTVVQTCIVHLIRYSMYFASWKDRKVIAAALKPIYQAQSAGAARERLEEFDRSLWGRKFPAIAQSWRRPGSHTKFVTALPRDRPERRGILRRSPAMGQSGRRLGVREPGTRELADYVRRGWVLTHAQGIAASHATRLTRPGRRGLNVVAMRLLIALLVVLTIAGVEACKVAPPTPLSTASPPPGDLLQPADIRLLGSFRIPPGGGDKCDTRAFSFGAIAYRSSDGSFFVTSHDYCNWNVAQFTVPAAPFAGQHATLVKSRWGSIPRDSRGRKTRTLGLKWDDARNRLCYTRVLWYNVSGKDTEDVGCIRADGITQDGPYEVGSNNKLAGGIALEQNGKFLLGLSSAQGIAGSNLGPSAYEVDLRDSPPATPGSAVALMEHPLADREIMHNGVPWYKGLTTRGAEVVGGTYLAAVSEGEREFYGVGCCDGSSEKAWCSQHGDRTFQKLFGFRPTACAKGYHNDHYLPYFYLYRMTDLEKDRSWFHIGLWGVHPYAYVDLSAMGVPLQTRLGDTDLDVANRRIFVGQGMGFSGVKIWVFGY